MPEMPDTPETPAAPPPGAAPTAPLAILTASAPRRAFATLVLVGLGTLLIWLGFAAPPASVALQLGLIGLGGLVLWLSHRLFLATSARLELRTDGLCDSSGAMLCRIEEIARIERGTFAFKPSNGFLIVLTSRAPRHWAPGLWWRMGRRIGVGGVTPGPQTKVMAEALASLIDRR